MGSTWKAADPNGELAKRQIRLKYVYIIAMVCALSLGLMWCVLQSEAGERTLHKSIESKNDLTKTSESGDSSLAALEAALHERGRDAAPQNFGHANTDSANIHQQSLGVTGRTIPHHSATKQQSSQPSSEPKYNHKTRVSTAHAHQTDTSTRELMKETLQRYQQVESERPKGSSTPPKLHRATVELMKEALLHSGTHRPWAALHQKEAAQRKAAAAPPPPNIHTATVELMKETLQRAGGHKPWASLHRKEALERMLAAAKHAQSLDVHTAMERIMDRSLRAARSVRRPFAGARGGGAAAIASALSGGGGGGGGKHDMASAGRAASARRRTRTGDLGDLVRGHRAALRGADAAAAALRRSRARTVHEAQQEDAEAVE